MMRCCTGSFTLNGAVRQKMTGRKRLSLISKGSFKEYISNIAKEITFEKLIELKEQHSKMKNLVYSELGIQNYLVDVKLKISQAQYIFKSRVRMTTYWENFKGWKLSKSCPICKDKNQTDTQAHSFNCKVIKQNLVITGQYEDVFKVNLDIKLVKTIENIEKFRKKCLED